MTRRPVLPPDGWECPDTDKHLLKWRALPAGIRRGVGARAYEIYLGGRLDRAHSWGAALGEAAMQARRATPEPTYYRHGGTR